MGEFRHSIPSPVDREPNPQSPHLPTVAHIAGPCYCVTQAMLNFAVSAALLLKTEGFLGFYFVPLLCC